MALKAALEDYCITCPRREAQDAEIVRLKAAQQWQPIETAPTNGTKFLAMSRKGTMRVDWLDVTLHTSQYCKERGDDRYTHWMSLPSPPALEEKP